MDCNRLDSRDMNFSVCSNDDEEEEKDRGKTTGRWWLRARDEGHVTGMGLSVTRKETTTPRPADWHAGYLLIFVF